MSSILDQGQYGENQLNQWFQQGGFSYVAICQSPESFSQLFQGNVKRPDFLLLLESIGLIAVDAKNYTPSHSGGYTLKLDEELTRSIAFERLFRIPIWYAYYSPSCWHWISALKALQVGVRRTNSLDGSEFIAIDITHFEQIQSPADIARLYTHRLPSISVISAFGTR